MRDITMEDLNKVFELQSNVFNMITPVYESESRAPRKLNSNHSKTNVSEILEDWSKTIITITRLNVLVYPQYQLLMRKVVADHVKGTHIVDYRDIECEVKFIITPPKEEDDKGKIELFAHSYGHPCYLDKFDMYITLNSVMPGKWHVIILNLIALLASKEGRIKNES